jgi:hypothetical protein
MRATLVAWPGVLPIQFRSVFERGDASPIRVYPINYTSSHPRILARLKERFGGGDVYRGLTGPQVVHLASDWQIESLEVFYFEHYGINLSGERLASFDAGDGRFSAWRLVEEPSQVPVTGGNGSG